MHIFNLIRSCDDNLYTNIMWLSQVKWLSERQELNCTVAEARKSNVVLMTRKMTQVQLTIDGLCREVVVAETTRSSWKFQLACLLEQ